MQTKRNLPAAIVFGLLTLGCMILIFLFSMQTADDSANESSSLYEWFLRLTGFHWISHNAFRKLAHFSEYAALGFFCSGTLYFPRAHAHPVLTAYAAFLYAMGDEIHQYFVPERAARAFDVGVDLLGAIAGILAFLLLTALIRRLRRQKERIVMYW